MADKVVIRLPIEDCAFLPHLLRKEIEGVERHRRVCDDRLSDETKGHLDSYIGQLRRCLSGAEAGIATWRSRVSADA